MAGLIPIAKLLILLGLAATAGYYLYTGAKVYRIERGDFLPTPYTTSVSGKQTLARLLEASDPVEWQLPGQGRQQAYYRPGETGAVVILLHGSPGSGAGFHPMVKALAGMGVGTLVMDLPGYGASEGTRSWGRHYDESVIEGLNFLQGRQDVEASRITVLGYSQGGNIASRAAAGDDRVARLIIMAGYTNLQDQLSHQFRWRLPGIPLFAMAAARVAGVDLALMDSVTALSQVRHKPMLVISGTNDQIIPVEMAETLAATSSRGQLWLVKGAGHIDLADIAGTTLYQRIADFARQDLTRQPAG